MSNYTLQYDQFIRSIEISRNEIFTFFLGAGASINSGVPSASDCIWKWKQTIFQTRSGHSLYGLDHKSDQARNIIQRWLDKEGSYPPLNDDCEYSHYVEQCYPIDGDRSKFFKSICEGKEPSRGYKMIVLLHKMGLVHSVWTTNFDDLCHQAAIIQRCQPIDIALDTVERIVRPHNSSELPIIKLHGDYRFGPLKNSVEELRNQDAVLREQFIRYVSDKHLIVSGYSGRDASVMEALKQAYSQSGAGRLYWCGYGHEIPVAVKDLLELARRQGRTAYYIPTDGFDKTMVSIAGITTLNDLAAKEQFDTHLKAEDKIEPRTKFSMDVGHFNTILKSNLFPIKFPQEVFQFDYDFDGGLSRWKLLKSLTADVDIVAVPYHKSIWAWGTLTEINRVFGPKLNGKINRVPIVEQVPWKDTALHNLLLSAVTKSLACRAGLPNNGKDKIWLRTIFTQKLFNNTIFFTHQAIRLGFTFDGTNSYLSFMPDFELSAETGDIIITKEIKQEVGRTYFEKIFNKEFSDYVNTWRGLLLDVTQPRFEIDYPYSSQTGFAFLVNRNPYFAGIMTAGSRSGVVLSEKFPRPLLNFKGIQYPEPNLLFAAKSNGMSQVPHDFHPMRGLSKHRPFDNSLVGVIHDNIIRLGVICSEKESGKFSQFLNRIQGKSVNENEKSQYLIDYPGFYEAYGVSINVPQPGMAHWAYCDEPDFHLQSVKEVALDLKNRIVRQIDTLTNDGIKKVIVICVPDRWLNFCSYDEHNEHFDLHDYIKAYCAEKCIATQFIKEETLKDSMHCPINWWLSLSYFVKSLRTPWALESLDKNTAFAGIGYSVTKRSENVEIVLGCSHIYNAQGQGLKYRLAKVEDKLTWDRMDRPHLSYHDAYKFGLSIIELFHSTMDSLPKRIVVHKRNYFTSDEINGLRDSLFNCGVKDLDLVEINFEDDVRFLAGVVKADGMPEIHGFPLARGTCIPLNGYEALLWTHGVVPSVKNSNYKFFLGGRYIPGPLKITKHYGRGNVGQLANEILGLTKVNWNSFDLYNPLPATVASSNEIARIGKLLSKREGGNYDYRFFI
jgi:hypothetical protein